MAFHEVRFPTDIAFGSRGGPKRKTIIAVSGSGHEHRNSQWADSKREYNAGYGIKSIDDIYTVVEFFEERRGMLHGFRWKDKFDWKSCAPKQTPAYSDQVIGVGDGIKTEFQLVKTYGSSYAPYTRDIRKPVLNTVLIGVNGSQMMSGWSVDYTTGIVTFDSPPANGHEITAGFEFDVPVRFDTDYLQIDLSGFEAGNVPDIPIVEIRV
jgi:TIGR02217 family protein